MVVLVLALAAVTGCGSGDHLARSSSTTAYNPRRDLSPSTTVSPSGGVAWSGRRAPPVGSRVPVARSDLGVLRVSLGLPAAVVGGSTLDYVVALTNPTGHPVAFAGCPLYQETIVTRRAVLAPAYVLNCDGEGAVGAGRTVRFQMRLPTPRVGISQMASVVWSVLDPSAINASGTVTVLAGPKP